MTSQPSHCELCELPAGQEPLTRVFDGIEKPFCCAGCLNVYTVLVESGLVDASGSFRQSELYQQSLKLGLISNRPTGRSEIPDGAEVREALYRLSGLWCTSCGWIIEHALLRERGVVSADVLFTSDLVKVKYCPQYIEPGRIPGRIHSLGYGASEYNGERESDNSEWRDLMLRLGIAGGLWMNVMLFSLVIYASYFETIAEMAHRVVPFILMALATPAVFYSGWPVMRIAFHGLRQGAIRMEALITGGILAAYGYSAAQAFLGGQHYYFDTACAIVTLVLTGKALERGAKEKTARSISLLYRLMPKKARLLHEGRERFVAIEAVSPGMRVLVKPGERIPVDGVVMDGRSPVDESVLTGEAEPRLKCTGDEVASGSCNGPGVLELRATRTGDESTLAQIIRLVENAINSRTPLDRSVDRVSRIFVPAVLAIAVLTLAGLLLMGFPPTEALLRAIAVLVIACPCALGIATPLATTTAVGEASRRGILIRDARVLETFRSVDVVVLDKTGTATEGAFRVRGCVMGEEALSLVAALEAKSEHPLARAIVQYVEPMPVSVSDVEVHRGLGISGSVGGRRIDVGSLRLMESLAIRPAGDLLLQGEIWESEGFTVVYAAAGGAVLGAVALGDSLRSDAIDLVRDLRAKGLRTMLLSGDSPATTGRVAARLGVDDFRGGVTPNEKATAVQRFRDQGQVVAMVGDGINDAPALAAADIGIAMGSGTDLAMQAAPVVLMTDSLDRIAEAFRVSASASRVVRQNLFWAFFYNTAGICLAITGILNPILAAGAMVISSLSVIGNSLRLGRRVRHGGAPQSAAQVVPPSLRRVGL